MGQNKQTEKFSEKTPEMNTNTVTNTENPYKKYWGTIKYKQKICNAKRFIDKALQDFQCYQEFILYWP